MSMDRTRATWNIGLWISNDRSSEKDRETLISLHHGNLSGSDVCLFCRYLYPNGTPDMGPGDMDNVDWDELALKWNAEYKTQCEKG
jgi:hypothetical protein